MQVSPQVFPPKLRQAVINKIITILVLFGSMMFNVFLSVLF